MATSVKIDGRTTGRPEQLQARVTRESGRKVTQQELLGRVVDRLDQPDG
jgi:hypothetical protein